MIGAARSRAAALDRRDDQRRSEQVARNSGGQCSTGRSPCPPEARSPSSVAGACSRPDLAASTGCGFGIAVSSAASLAGERTWQQSFGRAGVAPCAQSRLQQPAASAHAMGPAAMARVVRATIESINTATPSACRDARTKGIVARRAPTDKRGRQGATAIDRYFFFAAASAIS